MAEGIDALVLDVKTGDGAFMKTFEDARALAEAMVEIGRGMGKKVAALITDMEQPLGRAVGNALEVAECIETLKGRGPRDLESLSVELAAWMLAPGRRGADASRRRARKVRDALASGAGPAQVPGGDRAAGRRPARVRRPRAAARGRAETVELRAERGRPRGAHRLPRRRPRGHAARAPAARRWTAGSTPRWLVLHKKVGDLGDRRASRWPPCT